MIERLRQTLCRVHALAGADFSGIGLVVHEQGAKLPVFPLRQGVAPTASSESDIEQFLATISSSKNDLHDGFHLVSTEWSLTAVSQYFSPPILPSPKINWSRKFGGRYLAAQFGSAVPGVKLCGIATTTVGLAIFMSGHEIHFEVL